MKPESSDRDPGLIKSVSAAYLVLLLHVLLIAALGLLVIFFRGIVQYMFWIFLAGSTLLALSGFLFYRRMRAQGRTLREMVNSPDFVGRSVEISFLGGLASFKLGHPEEPKRLSSSTIQPQFQLEDPASAKVRRLKELADLLEKDLITLEEYNRTKNQMFHSSQKSS